MGSATVVPWMPVAALSSVWLCHADGSRSLTPAPDPRALCAGSSRVTLAACSTGSCIFISTPTTITATPAAVHPQHPRTGRTATWPTAAQMFRLRWRKGRCWWMGGLATVQSAERTEIHAKQCRKDAREEALIPVTWHMQHLRFPSCSVLPPFLRAGIDSVHPCHGAAFIPARDAGPGLCPAIRPSHRRGLRTA